MIDISTRPPLDASLAFALEWLATLADRDFDKLSSLVDEEESPSPLSDFFKGPDFERTWPLHPKDIGDWTFRFDSSEDGGFLMNFEVPFSSDEFGALEARFELYREGAWLRIVFNGLFAT